MLPDRFQQFDPQNLHGMTGYQSGFGSFKGCQRV
jgi:hypothetical protein